MKGLIHYKKMILKIAGFLLFFHLPLFANQSYSENINTQSVYSNTQQTISTLKTVKDNSNEMVVSLNSFGSMSVSIMLILTSLLGAFFVRDEFHGVLD